MNGTTIKSQLYTNGSGPFTAQPLNGTTISPTSSYGAPPVGYNGYNGPTSRQGSVNPSTAEIMLEGYRQAVNAGKDGDIIGANRNRGSSAMINLSDPVALHLLVETAKADSQENEIMAFEEVESLKKEQEIIKSRIEAAKRKLALETKLRDAAQSLNRLYSSKGRNSVSSSTRRNRRSITGSRGSVDSGKTDSLSKSEDEFSTSSKKCDELAVQLLQLEARYREIQLRLLAHTAGVLQYTHDGQHAKDGAVQSVGPSTPGRNYPYQRGKFLSIDDSFDDRSLYRSPENLDRIVTKPSLELQNQIMLSVERRLEDLNERIREVVVLGSPEQKVSYPTPHIVSPDAEETNRVACVDRQLDYLDSALDEIEAQQKVFVSQVKKGDGVVEERLQGINTQLCELLGSGAEGQNDQPSPPPVFGVGAEDQVNYLEQCLYRIGQLHESILQSANDNRQKAMTSEAEASQYEVVVTGLWSIMLSEEQEARKRKRARREALAANPEAGDDDDLSPDEDGANTNEAFSLQAFSSKIQLLYSNAMHLKEKQAVLRRQIKQQREMNSKSDTQRDDEFVKLQKEAREAQALHDEAEQKLSAVLAQLDTRQASTDENIKAEQAARRTAEDRLQELQGRIADLQDDSHIASAEMEARIADATAKLDAANVNLKSVSEARMAADEKAQSATMALEAKEKELRELEGDVVRLTTDLTFARAELDGAYGSRAQRAAEVAQNPEIQKQLDDLLNQNNALLTEITGLKREKSESGRVATGVVERERQLKIELEEMSKEYEELTRDAITYEKERERFEEIIDHLREEKEQLELDLSDERVKWLGLRSPSTAGGPMTSPEQTSIRMLREDFRKMMREKTAEGLKALRAEQEERKKLESLIRSLRKEQGSGKSGLSQSMTPI